MPQQRVHNSIPRSSSWTPFGKNSHFCTKPTQGHPKKGQALTAFPRCHTAALCLGLGISGLRPHQDAPLGSLAAAGCSGARHGLAGPGTAQQGQAQLSRARHSLARPGTVWQGQAQLSKARHGAALPGAPSAPAEHSSQGRAAPTPDLPCRGAVCDPRTQPQKVLPPVFLIPVTDFKVTKTEIISQCLISFSLPCRARRARTRLTGLCSMTEFKYLHSQGVSAQQTQDLSS